MWTSSITLLRREECKVILSRWLCYFLTSYQFSHWPFLDLSGVFTEVRRRRLGKETERLLEYTGNGCTEHEGVSETCWSTSSAMITVCSRAAGKSCLVFSLFEKYNNIQNLLNYFQKIVFECVLFYFVASITETVHALSDVSGDFSECLEKGVRLTVWS